MEADINNQQNSILPSASGVLLMPGINMSAYAISAVKTHKGIKNALRAQNNPAFKKLAQNMGGDVFSKSQALAKGYETYKGAAKTAQKATNKLNKFYKKNDISYFQKFKNLFKKEENKLTKDALKETLEKNVSESAANFKTVKETVEQGAQNFTLNSAKRLDDTLLKESGEELFENIAKTATKGTAKTASKAITKEAIKANAKGFGKYVKSNFKNELGLKNGKFNYIMTAIQFIPNVVKKVIPAFKEKGAKEGFKELGKTFVQAGADLVSYAAGGAVGRALGAAIGTIIAPGVGSAIGATVGDMVCSVIVGGATTEIVDRAIEKKEKADEIKNMSNSEIKNAIQNKNTLNYVDSNYYTNSASNNSTSTGAKKVNLTQEEIERIQKNIEKNKEFAKRNAYRKIPSSSFRGINSKMNNGGYFA